MERGSSEQALPPRGPGWGPVLIAAAAVSLLARAAPLAWAYGVKLRGLHSAGALAIGAAAGLAAFGALTLALRRAPRAAAAALAGIALVMALLAGNGAALAEAAGLLAATLLLGDLVSRMLLGFEPEAEDLPAVLAAGLVAAGLLVLSLAAAGLLSGGTLAVVALSLLAARARRLPRLARSLAEALRLPRGDAPALLEAGWLAFAALVLLACWAAAQAPDASWDALSYHLPEARDIALTGRVEALADLAPQSLLWHNHEAYLALGFFAGGERVVQLLQFAIGLSVFGAALALARRLRAAGAAPLLVLALAAFPTAMLQLHSAYVDWPAALLVTAAAAQLAARARAAPNTDGHAHARLAGFLLGGAAVTKVFALFALPALALLARRARLPGRSLAAALACAAVPLLPWLLWSHAHAGSVFAPYADSPGQLWERAAAGHFFTVSPASGEGRAGLEPGAAAARILRLPYDVVFHSSRFEGNGDGYNGVLALLLLLGVAGWGAAGIRRFLVAALPFLIPWSLLYLPSIRFLLPVYPLYAVFTAEGLRRLAGRFAGASGVAAGVAVLAAAAAFPVQLGSSGDEWRVALGRETRPEFLAARLPAWPLWRGVGPGDRLLFVGEYDRFHCPCAEAWRSNFRPPAAWNDEPAWTRGLAELRITHVLWRSDRAPELPPGFPLDRWAPVARNGPATLYERRRGPAPPSVSAGSERR